MPRGWGGYFILLGREAILKENFLLNMDKPLLQNAEIGIYLRIYYFALDRVNYKISQ